MSESTNDSEKAQDTEQEQLAKTDGKKPLSRGIVIFVIVLVCSVIGGGWYGNTRKDPSPEIAADFFETAKAAADEFYGVSSSQDSTVQQPPDESFLLMLKAKAERYEAGEDVEFTLEELRKISFDDSYAVDLWRYRGKILRHVVWQLLAESERKEIYLNIFRKTLSDDVAERTFEESKRWFLIIPPEEEDWNLEDSTND